MAAPSVGSHTCYPRSRGTGGRGGPARQPATPSPTPRGLRRLRRGLSRRRREQWPGPRGAGAAGLRTPPGRATRAGSPELQPARQGRGGSGQVTRRLLRACLLVLLRASSPRGSHGKRENRRKGKGERKEQGGNCSERTKSRVSLLSGLLLLLFGGQGGVASLIRGSLPSPPPDAMKEELISSPQYSTLCLESIVRTSNSRSLITTKYDLCFHQRQSKYPDGLKGG